MMLYVVVCVAALSTLCSLRSVGVSPTQVSVLVSFVIHGTQAESY